MLNFLRFVLSLFALACMAGLAGAQTDQGATIKAATEFVQVPVLVQKSGKHVGGLHKEDFALRQDGIEQPIATFEEVHAHGVTPTEVNQRFENTVAAGQTPPQLAIIAIDMINTSPMDQAYFKQQLIKFFSEDKNMPAPIGVMAFTRGGIRVLHDFTTDRASLLNVTHTLDLSLGEKNNAVSPMVKYSLNAAAQQVNLADEGTAESAKALFKNMTILNAKEDMMARFQDVSARLDSLLVLQQIAQALKGIPGRKTLLWAGSGFPFLTGSTITGNTGREFRPERLGQTLDQHLYTSKLLNDANVAVYPIDTRRTVNTAYEVMDPSHKLSPTLREKEMARENDAQIIDTFKSIAAETGGKACIYRTDLSNCVREATEDDQEYYLLGFYVDKSNASPGWHKIQVGTAQKASVRHRTGFIIAKTDPEKLRQSDILLALNSPYAYTSLHFAGRFSPAIGSAEKKTIPFQLLIPPEAVTIDGDQINFDIVAVVRGVGGKEVTRIGQRIQKKVGASAVTEIQTNGINYRNKVDLPAGDYGVWFVLRDNPTGRTGSVTVPLQVQ